MCDAPADNNSKKAGRLPLGPCNLIGMATPNGKQRRLSGSRRGSRVVKETFEAALTRRRLCALVGIHPTTLRRWERTGLLNPRTEVILGSPTVIFSEADLDLARSIKRMLAESPGTLSAAQAANRAKR